MGFTPNVPIPNPKFMRYYREKLKGSEWTDFCDEYTKGAKVGIDESCELNKLYNEPSNFVRDINELTGFLKKFIKEKFSFYAEKRSNPESPDNTAVSGLSPWRSRCSGP